MKHELCTLTTAPRRDQPTSRQFPRGTLVTTRELFLGDGTWFFRTIVHADKVTQDAWGDVLAAGLRGVVMRGGDTSPYPTPWIDILLDIGGEIRLEFPGDRITINQLPGTGVDVCTVDMVTCALTTDPRR